MGKRSTFLRRERDFYPTPESAVLPLVPHLPRIGSFWEPCAGDGALTVALTKNTNLFCSGASDIEPAYRGARKCDATEIVGGFADYFITNPPWPQRCGEPTLSIAKHLASLAPTWLLLSADFAHNRYFAELAPICVKIVSVGRVSWMQNGTAGKDNCAWYLFDAKHIGQTRFFGRAA